MKHFQQLYVKANFKKITGGGVKCLLFHTVPPPTKNRLKICFSPFHEALDNFSFFKFRVPGHTPGTRSWNTFVKMKKLFPKIPNKGNFSQMFHLEMM